MGYVTYKVEIRNTVGLTRETCEDTKNALANRKLSGGYRKAAREDKICMWITD